MNYRNKTIFDWNKYEQNQISSINSLLIMNNLKNHNLTEIRNIIIRDIDKQVGIIIQLNRNEYISKDDNYYTITSSILDELNLNMRTFAIQYLCNLKYENDKNIKFYKKEYIEFDIEYIDLKKICLLPNSFYQANINILPLFYNKFKIWIDKLNCHNLINLGDDGGNVCTILSSLFLNMISYFHCSNSFNCAEEMIKKNKINNFYLSKNLEDIHKFDKDNENILMFINPGRKGLSKNEINVIDNSKNVKFIIYMACNNEAFFKNLKNFLKKYEILDVEKIMNMPIINKYQFLYLIRVFN